MAPTALRKIHILGICGTFMAGVAQLGRQMGYEISGQDRQFYPPMGDLLDQLDIPKHQGYTQLPDAAQGAEIVIGNTMTRGMPIIEQHLNAGRPLISGPQWLGDRVLANRRVIAVAGTHGKTTTSSLLAWILEVAGFEPGYLIGGQALNFKHSAHLGEGEYFVIEADEYDTAFFDKRSKFMHYHPEVLVLNNLEFDHADIFEDLSQIQRQFHHLLRVMPEKGVVIYPKDQDAINDLLAMGCWSQQVPLNSSDGWQLKTQKSGAFEVSFAQGLSQSLNSVLLGEHNQANALAAIAAAMHLGVPMDKVLEAVATFKGVKRRLEVLIKTPQLTVYDDFAHHPTAILYTLSALKSSLSPGQRMIAVAELASNSMSQGVFVEQLPQAFSFADQRFLYCDPNVDNPDLDVLGVIRDIDVLRNHLMASLLPGDVLVLLSNKDFDGHKGSMLEALRQLANESVNDKV